MSPTPANLAIPARDLRFSDPSDPPQRWWLGGDPIGTALFNALSATFPPGERFFMDSVRAFRDGAPEPLSLQIAGFLAQEAIHGREHAAFNDAAIAGGYDLANLEVITRAALDRARARPPIERLGATAALEHFTAIMAHVLIRDEARMLDGAPSHIVRLWGWHAMEELEHKSVAFDVFLHATRDWPRFRRWALRARVMLMSTVLFVTTVSRLVRTLLKQDNLTTLATRLRVWDYVLRKPGLARRVFPAYLSYYLPGFHPWRVDDRPLLEQAEAAYARG